MSKRASWGFLVVLFAAGCNNNDVEPTVTLDEQEAIRKIHNVQQRRPGTEDEIKYLLWEGGTFTDTAKQKLRVIRVKFKIGTHTEISDFLYLFLDGKPIRNRLNGSGDHWQPEAEYWVRGKP